MQRNNAVQLHSASQWDDKALYLNSAAAATAMSCAMKCCAVLFACDGVDHRAHGPFKVQRAGHYAIATTCSVFASLQC